MTMTGAKTIIGGVIFFLVGAGVLVGDFFITTGTISFLNSSIKTDGSVVNIIHSRSSDSVNAMYTPEVSFTDASGQAITFTSNISSSSPSYKIGDKVSVLYDKNNSQSARINTFFQLWFATIVMSIVGVIFFLIGLFIIIKKIISSNLRKELLATGTKISAKVTAVESSNNFAQPSFGNIGYGSGLRYGKNFVAVTYHIRAQWLNPTDNLVYIFNSEEINYNPESFIVGKDIDVYIDHANPKRYYVDISSLPKTA
jgi:hypothetical protein